MRFIKKKTNEPAILQQFKKRLEEGVTYPTKPFKALRDDNEGTFKAFKQILAEEQGYVCAYCLGELIVDEVGFIKMKVEHFKPDSIFNGKVNTANQAKKLCDKKELERKDLRIAYHNLFAVCEGRSGSSETHCDTPPNGKGNLELCHIPNPSEGRLKKFNTKISIKYTKKCSIFSMDKAIDNELKKVLNLNDQQLEERRKKTWAGVASKIAIDSGINGWQYKKGDEIIPYIQQILDKYKNRRKDGKHFEFYDCIIYQLEERMRRLRNK